MENENNMTTEEYPAHPIAALFPMMKDDTEHPDVWEKFKSDIKANGVQEPGVLWKGQIIDGRNRQAAAIEVGVPFRTITKEFPEGGTDAEILKFVLSANLHRRHLTDSQRAAIAGELANMERGDNQYTKVPPNGGPSQPLMTTAESATTMNVSERSTERGKRLHKEDPEAHKDVKEGKTKLGTAEKNLKNKQGGKGAGKHVQTESKLPPEKKAERDLTTFKTAFKPALKIFEEAASLQTRKSIVRQLASDLNAEIHFAGEVMKPAPVTLTNNGASANPTT